MHNSLILPNQRQELTQRLKLPSAGNKAKNDINKRRGLEASLLVDVMCSGNGIGLLFGVLSDCSLHVYHENM